MNPTLRSMLVGVGVVALGGVGFFLYTPQPADRTMAELRSAGLAAGQRIVLTCPERLTPSTKRRINYAQPGALRPSQSYGRVARAAVCFAPDAGNCFRPADFALRVGELQGEVVVPSLRRDVVGLDPDAGEDTDGGEDAVDDSFQFRLDDCLAERCSTYDAGDGSNFCGRLNRLQLVTPPNMLPNCRGPDGGWDDGAGEAGHMPAPDCDLLTDDGGTRWGGCNSYARERMTGADCLPVERGVVAGDAPSEWL